MSSSRPSDCIYCGDPAGSAEHTILAALGGLRTHRGILCQPCNQRFGDTIDSTLAADMKPINAIVGVVNRRTGQPVATDIEDTATGRTYVLCAGQRVSHRNALVVSDTIEGGVRRLHAAASTQKQADDFVSGLKADGRPLKAAQRWNTPLLFACVPTASWSFGGTDTFRALARLVLNILATDRPRLARGFWLAAFKKFIVDGGDDEPWVFYDYSTLACASRVPEKFPFRHRFALMFDAETSTVYAHVSLLRIVELTILLGTTSVRRTESLVYDMDVLAECPPNDISVSTHGGLLFPFPTTRTRDPSMHVRDRLAEVLIARNQLSWERDAPALLLVLNAVRSAPPTDRYDLVVEALSGQLQRLLNLAVFVAGHLRRRLPEEFGDDTGRSIAAAFGLFVQPDAASTTGVTALTRTHVGMLRHVIAERVLEILTDGEINGDELRLLLEGGPGAAVVGKYMVSYVQQIA